MAHTDPEVRREYQRQYRLRNGEAKRQYHREWRKNNPDYSKSRMETNPEVFFRYVWHNARNRNRLFLLSLEDIMALWASQSGRCALTGMPMTHVQSNKRFSSNASLDRIDNSKGYLKGNVRLVCVAINKMRSNMTDEEFIFWCKAVL